MKNSERPFLRNYLNELIYEKKILKTGKFYALNKDFSKNLIGIIDSYKNKRYIIRSKTTNGRDRYYKVKSAKLNNILIGDKVEFGITGKKKKGEENIKIIKVIKEENILVTGIFEVTYHGGIVFPDSKTLRRDIYISRKDFNNAKNGDKVVCEILNTDEIDSRYGELDGRILEVLGKSGNTDVELLSVLKKYNLKAEFPKDVVKESEKVTLDLEPDNRIDLRDKICFTIDPIDAKDFDDAVSIETTSDGGFVIGVHIADVSHYVKENSAIDIEALNRGTSVYLVDKVIPMLPKKLSNDICTLQSDTDRLAFSVFIELNKKYEVKNYEIKKSIIRSRRRFTYEEVQEVIETKNGDYSNEILQMYLISKNLTENRLKTESIDFETKEIQFVLDDKGKVKDIKLKPRLDSMRLVEEFMLLANKCVTEFITTLRKKNNINYPFIYRIHDKPDPEKLRDLSEFVKQFGFNVNVNDKNSIKKLITQIKGRPEEYIINNLLIRSMAKAIYAPKNIGHYGLGFDDYTHFTSPIRRYPDLIVHRMLYNYISEPDDLKRKITNYKRIIDDVAGQCSAKEQNAVSAERETVKIKQIEYLKDHVGDEYEGTISGIIGKGLFIEITDTLIEGMVLFRDIKDDYYVYDSKEHCAAGLRKGKLYRAGDSVKIKVISIDMATKTIDFALI